MGLGLGCFEHLKLEMSVHYQEEILQRLMQFHREPVKCLVPPWERCLHPQAYGRGERGKKATAEEGQHGCPFVKAKAPVT